MKRILLSVSLFIIPVFSYGAVKIEIQPHLATPYLSVEPQKINGYVFIARQQKEVTK